ncbi:unnamed protein product [Brachionus calyciflorus]|uniref:Uncharacterized protein n=1 Tax=Brachionus calyciflorus TaxID=104777 RepID=A0A813Q5V9_9BILA|nr:unnamed protein product [Brachionus calyciflorus]
MTKRANLVEECKSSDSDSKSKTEYVYTCDSCRLLYVLGYVNEHSIKFVVDSGSTTSIISSRFVKKTGITLNDLEIKIKSADNRVTKVDGKTQSLRVDIEGNVCEPDFLVIDHEDNDGLHVFLTLLILPIGCIRVEGNIYYCETPNLINIANIPILNVDEDCHAKHKVDHPQNFAIDGEGFEFSKKIIKFITLTNFFGAKILEKSNEFVKLSKVECESMIKTKTCHGHVMRCSDKDCEFDGSPNTRYSWLSTLTKTETSCSFKKV